MQQVTRGDTAVRTQCVQDRQHTAAKDEPSVVRDCCVYVFTETWLHNHIPDSAIQLDKLTSYRADRDKDSGGNKS